MSESVRSEIIRNLIKEFVQKEQGEFLKLAASIDRLSRYTLKGYFDEDEHSGLEIFLKATEKIESGERHWDYDNIKIEAIVYQTSRSFLSNELKKKSRNKVTFVSFDDLAGEGMYDEEGSERGIKVSRTEGTYSIQEIRDDKIIKMVKAELPKMNEDGDPISIKVMEEIMKSKTITYEEIAKRLKINEQEVKNSIIRIRRAGDKVWLKLGKLDRERIDNLNRDYRMKDIKDKRINEEEEGRE